MYQYIIPDQIKQKIKIIPVDAMKTFKGDRIIAAFLLTSGLVGNLPPGKKPDTQWTRPITV